MENKQLLEEISRLKLLTTYNTRQTLTENEEIMEYSPMGGFSNTLAKELKYAAGEGKQFRNAVEDALGNFRHAIEIEGKKIAGHDARDIVAALAKGSLSAGDRGLVNAHLMTTLSKDTSAEAKKIKQAVIDDFIQTKSFTDKYRVKTEAEAVETLIGKGYSRADAENVVKTYKSAGGNFKPGGDIKIDINPVPIPPVPVPVPIPIPKPEPWWVKLWRNKTFKDAMKVAAGAGAAALLYWWMTSGKDDEEVKWVPFCLKNVYKSGGFTANDLAQVANQGNFDSFPMSSAAVTDDKGNQTILSNVVFSKDGTIESPIGKGTWVDRGSNVQIKTGGNVYIIDCSDNIIQTTTTPPPPVPIKTDECNGNYTQSTTFPFRMCQQSKEIGDVQKCLGITADTKFGSQTKNALGKGYLTRTEYDSIMKDCQGGGTGSPDRNKTGGLDL
jgi:hypothetical protein